MDNKNTNVIIDLGSHEIRSVLFKNEDNRNIIVASSKIKTLGFLINALAIWSFCLIPVERLDAFSSNNVSYPSTKPSISS